MFGLSSSYVSFILKSIYVENYWGHSFIKQKNDSFDRGGVAGGAAWRNTAVGTGGAAVCLEKTEFGFLSQPRRDQEDYSILN